ncbi:MAG: hypothetical protein KF858_01000 [Candidatus Sumerlaeia bacterium]|nr:hypothetical protein [Candidatus Sumerlaeia bacterium]
MKNLEVLPVAAAALLLCGSARAEQGTSCMQVVPGISNMVIFVDEDGNRRAPTAEEIARVQAHEKSVRDLDWVVSTDKSTGAMTGTLVDKLKTEKKAGQVVATIPITGGGNKALSNIVLVSLDGAGVGINDTTSRTPVGGNPGTTLGAQRLNAMIDAATFWADKLSSSVDIRIETEWQALFCDEFGATLGSAGTNTVHGNFTGAPVLNTWYHASLANKLFGSDLSGANNDIYSTYNTALDEACAIPLDWYYGLDGNAGANVDFRQVFLHEVGHGIGFATLVNKATGARLSGFNDIFMHFLYDETEDKGWISMTDGERVTSAINTGNLTWNGSNVTSYISSNPGFLSAGVHASGRVRMYAPDPLVGGSSVSHWDTVVTPDELMEPISEPTPQNILTQNLLMDLGWTGSLPVELDLFHID